MKTKNNEFDGIIVGGGPVGWLTALALSKSGAKVCLIAPDQTIDDERTVALMHSSIVFLESLGLELAEGASAAPLKSIRIIDDTGRLVRAPEVTFQAAEIELPFFALNVAVKDLVTVIHAKLKDYSNFQHLDSSAKEFRETDEFVVATTNQQTSIQAKFLIGADGRGSSVREFAKITCKKWNYPQSALVTSLSHEKPHHHISTEFHTANGPFTFVPMQANRSGLVWVDDPAEIQEMMAQPIDKLIKRIEAKSHRFLGAFSKPSKVQAFPISGMEAEKMATGRVFLVGESGHAMPPIGAQGLNLSMRDVECLSQILTAESNIDDASRLYASKRAADIRSRITGTGLLNRTLLSNLLPVQLARSISLLAMKNVSPLRRFVMRQGIG